MRDLLVEVIVRLFRPRRYGDQAAICTGYLGAIFNALNKKKPRESGELLAGPVFDRISNKNVSGESPSRIIGIASPELLRWSHWHPSFPNDECTMRFS